MLLPEAFSIHAKVPFAGEELARYLRAITGREPVPEGFPIRVDVADQDDEGYRVEVSPDGIRILGGSVRGAVYGVYGFLEECLGCQFWAEDCEIIPRAARPDIREGSFARAPAFSYREVYWRGALDGRFALKMGLNSARAAIDQAWGGRVMFYNYSHTFDELVPPDVYFNEHPEYFSMVDGARQKHKSQLCLTNPDVLSITVAGVLQWMGDNPDCRIFSVAMNDWYSPCQCPACAALDAREGSHAGTMITFVNAVADAAAKEFPQNFIHTFAYLYCRKAPRTVRPRPNVIVRLCSIESCFSHPMGECGFCVDRIDVETTSARPFTQGGRLFIQDLKDWAAICDTLYVWDYTTNFSNYLQPFPNFQVMGPNLRLMRDHGVKGVFEQGNYAPGQASAFAPLKIYLLSRLLWNPDQDEEALMDGFVRGYYGQAAAPALLAYLKLCKKVAQQAHMSLFDGADAPYLTEDFLLEGRRLFVKALAAQDDPLLLARIRREELSIRYAALVALPMDAPGRDGLIDAFAADAKALGIGELFERRALEASFACMKESRYARQRERVPYAVYRL